MQTLASYLPCVLAVRPAFAFPTNPLPMSAAIENGVDLRLKSSSAPFESQIRAQRTHCLVFR